MISLRVQDLDLNQICNSGQCFRMVALDEKDNIEGQQAYQIIACNKALYGTAADMGESVPGDKYLRVAQQGDDIFLDCAETDLTFWKDYFDLQTDYGDIKSKVDPSDVYLNAAVSAGRGIRILRQDLWEMIVSFLISQQNNIPRIRKCIDNICHKYGHECRAYDGTKYYSFPLPDDLAGLPEDALMECNLGYRSKYVVRTAPQVANGTINLNDIAAMDYEGAMEELLRMYGVGRKVADCISLFALHHVDAFPIDTHIKQVLEREYADGFPFDRYDGCAGIIQQYIFYYELLLQDMRKLK